MTRWWQRGGVRARLVGVSVLGVAVAFAVGILIFGTLLNRSLVSQLKASADTELELAADALTTGGPESVRAQDFNEAFRVQVVSSSGLVVFSNTGSIAPSSPLSPAPGELAESGASYWWVPFGDRLPALVVARGVSYSGVDYVVLVSASQNGIHEAVSTTAIIMLAMAPIVMVLVGGITWWLVGRTLRPVEAIRSQVDSITAARLDERVPVPLTHDEVSALALTMNEMLARLSAAHSAQLRFISDASHELRSPLAGLSGLLEVARQDDSLATWQELEPMLSTETEHMAGVVQNLLLLSRVDEGRLTSVRQDVDLDDLAWDEVGRLRASTDLTIETSISPVRAVGDRFALSHVLRNLCDNAVRHARTRIRVTADATDEACRWVVEDDGSGIPEEDRERVFERFVRLDESRSRDTGGSGLGLAIARDVVSAYGGSVRASASADLGGARFVVELPLTQASAVASASR